ncbi:MAG: hypothetical protein U5L96_05565 [Owenweeksia sp.]|nr:hypothetical protein [Owenweeksia sp.]
MPLIFSLGVILIFTFNPQRYAPDSTQQYQFIPQSEDAGLPWATDRLTDRSTYGSAFYSPALLQQLVEEKYCRFPPESVMKISPASSTP